MSKPLCLFRKGDRIYHQLKKLGSSLDWDRACFTMDTVSFLIPGPIWIDIFLILISTSVSLSRNFPMQSKRLLSACMRREWSTGARGWSTGHAHWTLPSLTLRQVFGLNYTWSIILLLFFLRDVEFYTQYIDGYWIKNTKIVCLKKQLWLVCMYIYVFHWLLVLGII